MIITLSNNQYMYKTILPDKITGQYWIKECVDGRVRNLICVEAIDGKWMAKSNKNAQFFDGENNLIKTIEIKDECVYILKTDSDEKSLLFANSYSGSGREFTRLNIGNCKEITIGRNENNVICYVNKFVSGKHAVIRKNGDNWSIEDIDSTNGTFVNNKRVNLKTLVAGDVVSIMGLRIVIGYDFISINNPNHQIVYNSDLLTKCPEQELIEVTDEYEQEETFFYRSPRLKRKIEPLSLHVSAPTARQDGEKVPMAMLMGPSMTMGLGSATTGIFSIINAVSRNASWTQVVPTVTMSFTMLCGMILWPVLTKKYEKKNNLKLEAKRQERYRTYLTEIRDEISRAARTQTEILNENNVSLTDCENIIMLPERKLWERSVGQDDFLELRVGIGDIPLYSEIAFPERGFTIDEDILQDDLQALAKEPKILKQVPITFSLLENSVSGVIGDEENVISFVKGLIIRMVATHSYDEVKLVVFSDSDSSYQWEFTKWLPHIWNNEKTSRFYADNENDAKELFSLLDKVMDGYESDETRVPEQFCVIINASKELTQNSETIKKISECGINYGLIIINVSDEIRNLPKECSKIIEIGTEQSKIYDKNDITGQSQNFKADLRMEYDENAVARRLSNIMLDLSSKASELPNMLTFLDMFKVGKIEHLNSLTRWKENNPIVTLKAPIGVDSIGNPFYLDLHEKFQGPHGLVAGMTGSGKSEFIITYILSMAVNYHPDEVAFILIDYKGGGLAGAFEDKEKGIKLPHLAGTITNLDGAAVKRSLVSIQSELRKRQAIFNQARRVSNEGTIDIYKYQKLYRDGLVSEPVPHLFIISDEFAELKSQQPEFMQQLISAARIGRSLGVHLILATQKPSGVVDDQIWSNSRFRICLKVQEKSDSMDMIKRPDAAELSTTGRFYLQVGFNEFFDIGQSAWCGASYVPSDEQEKKEIPTIQVIDNLGRVQKELKLANESLQFKQKMKQVVGIVNYLSDLAKDENVSVAPLWLEEIPAMIYLENVLGKYAYKSTEKYVLEAVLGEYDDPFNQSQNIFKLPLTEKGNAIVYGNAASGKELFLTTTIFDLCNRYSPEYLNMYILDFGNETLQNFAHAPHVGDVILSADEEKVLRLMKLLRTTLLEHKKLLSEAGGTYELYYKNNTKPLKNIVVIINNFAALNELYEDAVNELAYLTREGTKYGIYFIFTASSTSEVKYRISQNCGQNIALQMNDKSDYVSIVGTVEGTYPSKYPGRGVVKYDHVYEFQVAHICEDSELQEVVKAYVEQWNMMYSKVAANTIRVVPEKLTAEDFNDVSYGISDVPIGIELTDVTNKTFDFSEMVITPVLATEYKKTIPFSNAIKKLFEKIPDIHFEVLNEKTSEEKIVEIFRMMVFRNNNYKATGDNSEYDRHIYMIEHPKSLFKNLSDDGVDKLKILILKCELEYKVNFVFVDDANELKTYSNDEWFKTRYSSTRGIWIGDGFEDQYILKSSLMRRDLRDMKNDIGLVISDDGTDKIKLVFDTVEDGQ